MTESADAILSAESVTFGFERRPAFLQPVSLDVSAGRVCGIIGPNGAGKSTLLRLLAGIWKPTSGSIRLDGAPMGDLSPMQRARRVAFLPQHPPRDVAVAARQLVLMGRFPHRRFGLFESAEDFGAADAAMTTTHTSHLSDRDMSTLSGGEAQRVHVAAALAQQPAVLLLDEPTAALDLRHQISIFSLIRRLASDDGLAVIVVTHDLNLAARYCDQALLLHDGRPIACGPPAEVIRPARLQPVYGVELVEVSIDPSQPPWIAPLTAAADEFDENGAPA